jgi:hypothetical protein
MALCKKELNNLPSRLKRIYEELLKNRVDVAEDYKLRGRRLEVFLEELDYAFILTFTSDSCLATRLQ